MQATSNVIDKNWKALIKPNKLEITSNEDKSYDVAYWADDKTKPYPIGIEIDGKEVAKDAKIIKFLFHPEMK